MIRRPRAEVSDTFVFLREPNRDIIPSPSETAAVRTPLRSWRPFREPAWLPTPRAPPALSDSAAIRRF
jgi:hypothetical protein